MKSTSPPIDGVIVVDSNTDDYGPLVNELHSLKLRVRLFSTGDDALRTACTAPSTLWIVNAHLPDLSGFDLLMTVRRRSRRCNVFLVGDNYSAADECAARLAGATAYVCKPASADWLAGFYPRCRSPAIRAGPVFS